MSTYFRPLQPVSFDALFDGCLESFGVREHTNDNSTERCRQLTDGNNFLWAHSDEAGLVSDFVRYLPCGAPGRILAAVAEVFATTIVSEYEPEYWGFETQEEWDTWEQKKHEEDETRFYEDLMKYVRGEAHGLRPGTLGMGWAERQRS